MKKLNKGESIIAYKWLDFIPHGMALIISAILFLTYYFQSDSSIKETKLRFPTLKLEDSLNAKIAEKYCPKHIRCNGSPYFIVLTQERNISIYLAKLNNQENIVYEEKLLLDGDSLVKKSNSDTLFIYNFNNSRRILHKFIIGDSLCNQIKVLQK